MFEKTSLRTRLSFSIAIKQLGGGELTLRPDELHLSKGGESLVDTAKIISTFGNAFMLRTDSEKKLDILKNGTFRKVVRSDLIAGYLGQTALKTT